MFVNRGVDWNEPLGMEGSSPEDLSIASGGGLVRMGRPTGFGRGCYTLDSFGKCDRKRSCHSLVGICPSWVTLSNQP